MFDGGRLRGAVLFLAMLVCGGAAVARSTQEEDRQALCRRLGLAGSADDVPRLVELLADPDCAEAARQALERIPGEESLAALRRALGEAKGALLAGVVNSLGTRRDAASLGALADLAVTEDPAVRAAAMTAIGRIGGPEAGRLLRTLESAAPPGEATRAVLGHAMLECATGSGDAGLESDAEVLWAVLIDERFPRAVRIGAFLARLARAGGERTPRLMAALKGGDPVLVDAALRYLATPDGRSGLRAVVEITPELDLTVQERLAVLVKHTTGPDAEALLSGMIERTASDAVRADLGAALLTLRAARMENLARGATATSPDGVDPDHDGREAPAAIDGDPATYWDETDRRALYRLVLTLPEPRPVSALSIQGWAHHDFAPRDFEVRLDGRTAARVRDARYDRGLLWVLLPRVECTAVELWITGYYGQSPAIRELGVYDAGETNVALPRSTADEVANSRGLIPDEEYERIFAAAPDVPRVAPRMTRRLLVYSRCFGYIHSSIPYGKVAFSILGAKTGAWTAELHDDLEVFEAENLGRFDAIVFNSTNNEIFLPSNYDQLDDEEKRAADQVDSRLKRNLLDFVVGGKGLAVIHAGVATFRKWPEFGELMGARFQNHPWGAGSRVALTVDDPAHPVSAALRDGALPEITDEIYQLAPPYSRDDARVLLSVDLSKTKVTPQQEATFLEARDFPMSYVRRYKKGRVFYNAFGHQHEVFWNPVVLRHWLDGVQFALGDLEGDTTPSSRVASTETPRFEWRREDDAIALLNGDKIVWRLNRDFALGKAYFHPVSLLDGTPLTWLSPPDHVWHRALWFEWKFINGVNYWEEVPGRGLTEILEMDTTLESDFSARMRLAIEYRPPDGEPVMHEERRIAVSAPDAAGCYRIDWTGVFTPLAGDVLLDRTPPPDEPEGKSWGGYSGMSVRLARQTSDWRLTDSEGRVGMECHRRPARWIHADFVHAATGREAGIAILDSPENPRHPTPSYIVLTEDQPFIYYSPALLFNGPYSLRKGDSLTLSYRVLVHPGRIGRGRLDEEWKAFASAPGPGDR